MKTPYFAVALVVVALSLAPASFPCQAGSVTYGFTEGTGAPNPGEIGATITLSSPPATPTSPWEITSLSDISSVQITDPLLFPDSKTGNLPILEILSSDPITSLTGHTITSGGFWDTEVEHRIVIFPTVTWFESVYPNPPGSTNFVNGSWVASASVPEPASAVQAGIAVAIGLALAAFRKRKEARRQRPVGPLGANQ